MYKARNKIYTQDNRGTTSITLTGKIVYFRWMASLVKEERGGTQNDPSLITVNYESTYLIEIMVCFDSTATRLIASLELGAPEAVR